MRRGRQDGQDPHAYPSSRRAEDRQGGAGRRDGLPGSPRPCAGRACRHQCPRRRHRHRAGYLRHRRWRTTASAFGRVAIANIRRPTRRCGPSKPGPAKRVRPGEPARDRGVVPAGQVGAGAARHRGVLILFRLPGAGTSRPGAHAEAARLKYRTAATWIDALLPSCRRVRAPVARRPGRQTRARAPDFARADEAHRAFRTGERFLDLRQVLPAASSMHGQHLVQPPKGLAFERSIRWTWAAAPGNRPGGFDSRNPPAQGALEHAFAPSENGPVARQRRRQLRAAPDDAHGTEKNALRSGVE